MKKPILSLLVAAGLCAGVGIPGGPVPCEVRANHRDDPPAAQGAPAAIGIGGDLKVPPYRLVRLAAQGLPEGAGLDWTVESVDDPAAVVDWATDSNAERPLWTAPPGRYRVEMLVVGKAEGGKVSIKRKRVTVTIGTPPKPPTPTPTPTPTPPKPDDPPKPITGMRVLIVRESSAPLAAGQSAFVNSTRVREYLNSKCAKGPKGQPEWRVYDPDEQFAASESPTMKKLFEDSRPQIGVPPKLVIASDTRADVYPLPDSEDAGLALLQRFGGK